MTVPASMALWSDWDVTLHHFRRYDRAQLRALFPAEGWEMLYVNYTNVVVYPAVWGVRKWRKLRRALGLAETVARTEDQLPPRWLNALLRGVFTAWRGGACRFPLASAWCWSRAAAPVKAAAGPARARPRRDCVR